MLIEMDMITGENNVQRADCGKREFPENRATPLPQAAEYAPQKKTALPPSLLACDVNAFLDRMRYLPE